MKKVKLTTVTLALLAGTVVAPVYSTTTQAAEATKTSETVKEVPATTETSKETAKTEVAAPKTEASKEVEVPKTETPKEVEAPKTETPKAEKTELEKAKEDALAEIKARVEYGVLDENEAWGMEVAVKDAKTIEQVNTVLGKKTPTKPVEKTELEKVKEDALAEIKARVEYGVIDENEAWGMEVAVKDAKTIEQVNTVLGKKTPTKPVEKTELEKAKEKATADVKMQLGMNYLTQEQANNLDLAIAAATSVEEINKLMDYKPTEPTKPEVNKELEKAKDTAFAELQKLVDEGTVDYQNGLELMTQINDAKSIDELKALGFLKGTEVVVDAKLEAAKDAAFAELKDWFENDLVTYEEAWELTAQINGAKSIDELKALGFLKGTEVVVDAKLEAAKDEAFAELKDWFENDLVTYEEAWELTAQINDAKSIDELKALGFLLKNKEEAKETKGDIIVKYVDQDGKEIKESTKTEGIIGETATVNAAEITGYVLQGPSSQSVEYAEGPRIITFTYKSADEAKETKGDIIVKYVDQDGKEIKESTKTQEDIGKTATVNAAEITGYVLQGPSSLEVEYSDSPKTITFVYKSADEAKETKGDIIVKYVDQDGKEIKESTKTQEDIGKTATVNAVEITGYVLQGPSSLEVEYSDSPKTITFVYKSADEAKETTSKVTVNYVDQDGKEIKKSDSLEKEIGEIHTFNAAEITGYVLQGPSSQSVEYADSPQTITFTYKSADEAKETKSTITIKYVDKNGKELIKSDSLTKEIGDVYEFSAAKIEGYKLVGPSTIVLEFKDSPQTASFTYEKVTAGKKKEDKKDDKNNKKEDNKNNKKGIVSTKKDAVKTNKKATLPQTGEAANVGLLAGGFMSMLTAAFVFFRKNK